jgi:hypothetical protein
MAFAAAVSTSGRANAPGGLLGTFCGWLCLGMCPTRLIAMRAAHGQVGGDTNRQRGSRSREASQHTSGPARRERSAPASGRIARGHPTPLRAHTRPRRSRAILTRRLRANATGQLTAHDEIDWAVRYFDDELLFAELPVDHPYAQRQFLAPDEHKAYDAWMVRSCARRPRPTAASEHADWTEAPARHAGDLATCGLARFFHCAARPASAAAHTGAQVLAAAHERKGAGVGAARRRVRGRREGRSGLLGAARARNATLGRKEHPDGLLRGPAQAP